MKMKCGVIAATAAVLSVSSAHAEYVNRYSEWKDLTKIEKSLYAQGLVDGGLPDDDFVLDRKADMKSVLDKMDGTNRCIRDNGITGNLLVDMIDNAYAKDISIWSLSPNVILKKEIDRLCQPFLAESKKRNYRVP